MRYPVLLLLCAFASSAAAVAQPAEPVASTADPDLQTIGKMFMPDHALEGMIVQGVVLLHDKLAGDPEWQKIEQQYPGITDVYLNAVRTEALSHAATATAGIQQDMMRLAAEKLTPGERAASAAYLRTSLPQRWAHQVLKPMPGETVTTALSRMNDAYERSATPAEVRRAEAFYATPTGRKFKALENAAGEHMSAGGGAAAVQMVNEAMAKGKDIIRAYAQQHKPAE